MFLVFNCKKWNKCENLNINHQNVKMITIIKSNILCVLENRNKLIFTFVSMSQTYFSLSTNITSVCSAELSLLSPIYLYMKPLLRASWGADPGHTFSAKTYWSIMGFPSLLAAWHMGALRRESGGERGVSFHVEIRAYRQWMGGFRGDWIRDGGPHLYQKEKNVPQIREEPFWEYSWWGWGGIMNSCVSPWLARIIFSVNTDVCRAAMSCFRPVFAVPFCG